MMLMGEITVALLTLAILCLLLPAGVR